MGRMVDMALSTEEKVENLFPSMAQQNNYPSGLSIWVGNDEMEKLGLEPDCEVGDMIEITGMAKVTSVSSNDTGEGPKHRVELQITHLSVEGDEEEAPKKKIGPGSLYKK